MSRDKKEDIYTFIEKFGANGKYSTCGCCHITPLIHCYFKGWDVIVKYILNHSSYKINYQDNNKRYTDLHMACIYGYHSLIKKLLKRGANLYLKDIYGRTSLSIGMSNSNRRCKKYIKYFQLKQYKRYLCQYLCNDLVKYICKFC